MSELANRPRELTVLAAKRGQGGLVTGVPRGGLMAPNASSVMTMPQTGQPEQLPVSPRSASADSPTAGPDGNHRRALEVAPCSLCGVARPLGLLVPDSDPTSADVRWYCKDIRSCTERWTAALPRRSAGPPETFGHAVPTAGEPAPAGASAQQLGGMPEEVQAAR